eukprot:s2534_g6.t1
MEKVHGDAPGATPATQNRRTTSKDSYQRGRKYRACHAKRFCVAVLGGQDCRFARRGCFAWQAWHLVRLCRLSLDVVCILLMDLFFPSVSYPPQGFFAGSCVNDADAPKFLCLGSLDAGIRTYSLWSVLDRCE